MKKPQIIAVVGAGGKTSWILNKTGELISQGKNVIITTTTHMAMDSRYPLVLVNKDGLTPKVLREISTIIQTEGYVLVAGYDELRGKLTGIPSTDGCPEGNPSGQFPVKLLPLCDVLLVEADGSRQLPVKAPGPLEPQIPDCADTVVGVIGDLCLGKKIRNTAFRPEVLADRLGVSMDTILTEKHLQQIAERSDLLRKGVGGRKFLFWRRPYEPNLGSGSLKLVLLAAGFSHRFGSNKLFAEIEGRTLFERSLERMLHVQDLLRKESLWAFVSLVVVTQYDEIMEECLRRRIPAARNRNPERGISSSIQTGLKADLPADATLFATSDQPWLTETTLTSFLLDFRKSGKGIGCLSHHGESGNPCVFLSKYEEELFSLTGDQGGKRVLKAHPEDVRYFEVSDSRELLDIDRREDCVILKTGV